MRITKSNLISPTDRFKSENVCDENHFSSETNSSLPPPIQIFRFLFQFLTFSEWISLSRLIRAKTSAIWEVYGILNIDIILIWNFLIQIYQNDAKKEMKQQLKIQQQQKCQSDTFSQHEKRKDLTNKSQNNRLFEFNSPAIQFIEFDLNDNLVLPFLFFPKKGNE